MTRAREQARRDAAAFDEMCARYRAVRPPPLPEPERRERRASEIALAQDIKAGAWSEPRYEKFSRRNPFNPESRPLPGRGARR